MEAASLVPLGDFYGDTSINLRVQKINFLDIYVDLHSQIIICGREIVTQYHSIRFSVPRNATSDFT
jgi:hypothetical protein